MNTPIVDFVKNYIEDENALRLHMPGHKGQGFAGILSGDGIAVRIEEGITSKPRGGHALEAYDITEIPGADSLYEADGIIAQSEDNAGQLFGARTFYSTEGSSLCIRAMLYLALINCKTSVEQKRPWILAGRNAHKTFLSAVALLDLDVKWLYPKEEESYLSCHVTAEDVETGFKTIEKDSLPMAVYITSPDYLGNRVDIAAIAKVCHRYGVLLLVDNAHGAYLKFLPKSEHPMDLGADMCCDSAHKTLPALTGAAYLHVGKHLPECYEEQAKNAMALFGSTSPSYLILQSLDAVNKYLAEGYKEQLQSFVMQIEEVKTKLQQAGFRLTGNEPLKITINAKSYGYTGYELAEKLSAESIVCEFADPDYTVLMMTPQNTKEELEKVGKVLLEIPMQAAVMEKAPIFRPQPPILSVREAMFSKCEKLPINECKDRILGVATVGCPPAVPIVICGEQIDSHAIKVFQYYGIQYAYVLCEKEN